MNDELNSRSRADYSLMCFTAFLSQIWSLFDHPHYLAESSGQALQQPDEAERDFHKGVE